MFDKFWKATLFQLNYVKSIVCTDLQVTTR